VATVAHPGPFATKPTEQLIEAAEGTRLRRAVGALDLTALGMRGFRVPLVPVVPLIGAALCIYLMTKLPIETWLRFGVWLLIGLVIYVVYGYRNSQLRRGGGDGPGGTGRFGRDPSGSPAAPAPQRTS
jgi:C-terminus of AA_permease